MIWQRRIRTLLILLLLLFILHLPNWVVKFVGRLWPFKEKLAGLIVSIIGNQFLIGFIPPVTVGFLYLLVFFPIIKIIYPKPIQEQLQEYDLLTAFRGLVAFQTVLTFLVGKGMLAMPGSDAVMTLFTESFYGVPIVWWLNSAITICFTLLFPLSIGYVLSQVEGGITSQPDPDGAAVALIESLEPVRPTKTYLEEKSPFVFWLSQGLYHGLPAMALGLLFLAVEAVSPVVEILIGLGIVSAVVLPMNSTSTIETFDIEHRLSRLLRFTTVNLRGLLSSLSLITGCVIVGLLVVKLTPLLFHGRTGGVNGVGVWVRVGLGSAIAVYAVFVVKYILSLANRLPWFVKAWSTEQTLFSSRRFDLPSDGYPPRFTVGPTLPTLFLLASVSTFIYPTSIFGQLYLFGWPSFVIVMGWLFYKDRRQEYLLVRDNRATFLTMEIQLVAGTYIAMSPVAVYGPTGDLLVPSTGYSPFDFSSILLTMLGVIFASSMAYYSPEFFEWLNKRTPNEVFHSSHSPSGQEMKLYAGMSMAIISIEFAWVVLMVHLMFDDFWLLGWYLLIGLLIITIMIWHFDSEVFEEGELPTMTFLIHLGWVILYLLGFMHLVGII